MQAQLFTSPLHSAYFFHNISNSSFAATFNGVLIAIRCSDESACAAHHTVTLATAASGVGEAVSGVRVVAKEKACEFVLLAGKVCNFCPPLNNNNNNYYI